LGASEPFRKNRLTGNFGNNLWLFNSGQHYDAGFYPKATFREKRTMGSEDIKSETGNLGGKVRDISGARAGDTAQLEQTYEAAKEGVQQTMGDIERQIRDKPVQAALFAAGAGLLLGVLLTR
jgi:ElaB/YqjD/DUF883 family membrane-anchored ribosome-binding protein